MKTSRERSNHVTRSDFTVTQRDSFRIEFEFCHEAGKTICNSNKKQEGPTTCSCGSSHKINLYFSIMSSRCLSPSLASDFSDHDNDDDVSYALPSSLTMRTSPNTTTTTSATSRKRRSLFPGTSGNHSVRGVAGVEDDDNDNDSIQNMGEWRRAQYETSPRKQLKQYWQLCYGGIASPHGSKDPQSLPNITPRPSVSFKSTTTSTITPNKGW